MYGYMTEIDTVEMIDTQEIEADGEWHLFVLVGYSRSGKTYVFKKKFLGF